VLTASGLGWPVTTASDDDLEAKEEDCRAELYFGHIGFEDASTRSAESSIRAEYCMTCDGRKCIECVMRHPHDACGHTCPTCAESFLRDRIADVLDSHAESITEDWHCVCGWVNSRRLMCDWAPHYADMLIRDIRELRVAITDGNASHES